MGTTADLGTASLAATQIQTSGRSATDIQKDLSAWLTTAAGTFAGTIKNLDTYIFPGEDKFTGLIRLATSLQGVNIELATIGGTLIESTMKGADAAYNMASAFGGLDKLQTASATYQKSIFTDTEQAAMKAKGAGLQVTAAFTEMGIAAPATKEAFKSLVNGLDLTTDRGRALLAALLGVSESFATVIDQATKLAKALSDSKQDLAVRALNATGNSAQGSLQKLAFDQEQERLDYTAKGLDLTQLLVVQQLEWNKAIVDTTTAMREQDTELKARKDTLSNMLQGALSVTDTLLNLRTKDSSLSAGQQLTAAHDLYQNTLTAAKSTDAAVSTPAMNNLGSVAQAYIDLAKSSWGVNSQQYQGIYGAVTGELSTLLTGKENATVTELQLLKQVMTDTKTAVDSGTTATGLVNSTLASNLSSLVGSDSSMVTYLVQYLQVDAATKQKAADVATVAQLNAKLGTNSLELAKYDPAVEKMVGLNATKSTLDTAIADTKKGLADKDKSGDLLAQSILSGRLTALVGQWVQNQDKIDALSPSISARDTLYSTMEGLRGQIRALGGVPSYAVGSPFIPSDQLANIHQGEMIIDRRSADVLRTYGVPMNGAADNRAGVEEQQRTTAELQTLVRLQSAANQAIIERLDASEDRLRTIENQGRLAA